MRPIVLVCGALLALAPAACSSSDARRQTPTPTAAAATPAAPANPLTGTWDTGPIPKRKLREVLRKAGYTAAQTTAFLEQFGVGKAYEFKLRFYEEDGDPFLTKKGWDPSAGTEPDDGDHGPYTLLGEDRFEARGIDPPTDRFKEVYAYRVNEGSLALEFVSLDEPGMSEVDVTTDTMLSRIRAARPFKRVE